MEQYNYKQEAVKPAVSRSNKVKRTRAQKSALYNFRTT